jgi:hypothetical protein
VDVCVWSRLEGITNGRRAASKSKSGSGARWAVSSLRDWVKVQRTCANGGFDMDNDREMGSVRGYVWRFNESNVSRRIHSSEFVSWPDRYLMCLLRLGMKFAGTSRKSSQAVSITFTLRYLVLCSYVLRNTMLSCISIWQCIPSGEATIGTCVGFWR